MARSVYVAAVEPGSGKLVVALGLLEAAARRGRIGFFRPVVGSVDAATPDNDVDVVRDHYRLDQPYRAMVGVTTAEAEHAAASRAELDDLLKTVVARYKTLERQCDVVVIEGADVTGASATVATDLNAEVALNIGSPVVVVVDAHGRSPEEVMASAAVAATAFTARGCTLAAIVANKADAADLPALRTLLTAELADLEAPVYVVPDVPELRHPTVDDVATALGGEYLLGGPEDARRDVKTVKAAAMYLPHFLDRLTDDTLVIVPGDRADVIIASLATRFADDFPTVVGLVLTTGTGPEPAVARLMQGLREAALPVVAVETDTFETASAVAEIEGEIRAGNERKIATALGVVEANIDLTALIDRVAVSRSTAVTPIMFEHDLIERARAARKHIVLPEGADDRILRAADLLRRRDVVELTLLGDAEHIRARAEKLGLALAGVNVINPATSDLLDDFAQTYYDLRKHKGVSEERARDTMTDVSYFGTMLVYRGLVDGMVSGAMHTTAHTIRPSFEFIKTRPGVSIVSSVFLMCLADQVLVYGDCAVNPNPTAPQLADIAISSAETAKVFGIEPRVAMLSYSTGTSGTGADVERVREATEIARERRPDLSIEGPIQYDAAVDADVARTKMPKSDVAGRATVFVFPDLNTGNNTYKAVQRSANAVAVGPVLQGLRRPVNDLSRGALVTDIVNTVAITAVQAADQQASAPLS